MPFKCHPLKKSFHHGLLYYFISWISEAWKPGAMWHTMLCILTSFQVLAQLKAGWSNFLKFSNHVFCNFFLVFRPKNWKNKWNNSVLAIESQVQDTLSSVYIFLSIIRWRKIRGKFWLPCRPTWTSNIVEWMFPIWVYFLRPILTVSSEKYWRNW